MSKTNQASMIRIIMILTAIVVTGCALEQPEYEAVDASIDVGLSCEEVVRELAVAICECGLAPDHIGYRSCVASNRIDCSVASEERVLAASSGLECLSSCDVACLEIIKDTDPAR